MTCYLLLRTTQDCVQKTINRMEQKLSSSTRVLSHVEYMLRSGQVLVRLPVASFAQCMNYVERHCWLYLTVLSRVEHVCIMQGLESVARM